MNLKGKLFTFVSGSASTLSTCRAYATFWWKCQKWTSEWVCSVSRTLFICLVYCNCHELYTSSLKYLQIILLIMIFLLDKTYEHCDINTVCIELCSSRHKVQHKHHAELKGVQTIYKDNIAQQIILLQVPDLRAFIPKNMGVHVLEEEYPKKAFNAHI